MKKLEFKEIAKPALALFLICLIAAFLLAGTNALTKDKIAENQYQQEMASRKVVFSAAESFGDDGTVTVNGKSVSYTVAYIAGEKAGYVFTSVSKGYGGDVSVMTAVDIEGNVIKSTVLSMSDETPGLGQNAGKTEFLDQFSNKKGLFSWVKSGGSGNEITGVTSASFTSKAVIECVNDAVMAFGQIGGGK